MINSDVLGKYAMWNIQNIQHRMKISKEDERLVMRLIGDEMKTENGGRGLEKGKNLAES